MLFNRILAVFATTIFFVIPAYAAQPVNFTVVPTKSRIAFEVLQDGAKIAGQFPAFTATISFHPDALDQSKVEVVIDTGKVTVENTDAQGMITKDEWLNVSSFPQAKFVTQSFKKLDDKNFEAAGNLTLKGVTLPVTFAFTLHSFGKEASISGEAKLKRKDFNIGWADTKSVSDEVKVKISVKAVASSL